MTAPTHIAFGNILFFALAGPLGIPLNPVTASAVTVGSLIPDIDTPTSAIGRIVFPLARWIEGRWGHRTITHSFLGFLGFGLLFLPLVFIWPMIYGALLVGIISHPIIDTVNTTGVALGWPAERRIVFPYIERQPTKFRIQVGSFYEMVLLGVLVVLLMVFYPVGRFGFRRVLHYLLANPYGAVHDYRMMAGNYKVVADVQAIDLLTQKHFSGRYEVLGALGQSTLIIRGDDGLLHTLGLRDDCNYYPKKIRCRRAKKITVITQEVDMTSRTLGDIYHFLDPTKEQYLYGSLKAEGRPDLIYKFRAYNPVFRYHDFLMFNLATWKDIEEAKIGGVYVTNGKMTIKTLLKEEESLEEKDLTQVAMVKSGYQKVMNVSFYVQELEDILVKEGEQIKTGQVLAWDQEEIDETNRMNQDLRDLEEQRERTERLAKISLHEIDIDIQRKEKALAIAKEKEEKAKELYESGVVGMFDYQKSTKKREELEDQVNDLKAKRKKEDETTKIQLLSLDKNIRNLKEEIKQKDGEIRSKVDGLVTAMRLSNSENKIRVSLEVLTRGLEKEER